MGTEKKENPIVKGGKSLLPYFLTPAMLVYLIWASAEYKTESKHLQFTSPDMKVNTEDHVKNDVNEVEHYKALKTFDSILQEQRIYTKETKLRRKKQDSLDLLDKATIFQMKEELKKINNKIKDE